MEEHNNAEWYEDCLSHRRVLTFRECHIVCEMSFFVWFWKVLVLKCRIGK